jgi:hypothetical protein
LYIFRHVGVFAKKIIAKTPILSIFYIAFCCLESTVIMIIIAILLLFTQMNVFASNYAFVSSSKISEVEDRHWKQMYTRIYGDSLILSKPGFYVFIEKEGMTDEFSIAYFPLKTNKAKISYVPRIPCYTLGRRTGEWLECNSKLILKHKDKVINFCKKETNIPDSLQILIEKFFDEHRMSIVESGFAHADRGLFVIRIDGKSNRSYFYMPFPKSLKKDYEKNEFISDYLKLYESFAAFMMHNFENCRWTNFGNASEIMEACRDFVPKELWNDESVKSQILRDSK